MQYINSIKNIFSGKVHPDASLTHTAQIRNRKWLGRLLKVVGELSQFMSRRFLNPCQIEIFPSLEQVSE